MNGQIAGPSVFSLELVALIVGVSMIVGAVDLFRQPGWAWKRAEESKIAYLILVVLVPVVGVSLYVFKGRPKVAALSAAGRAASLPFERFGEEATKQHRDERWPVGGIAAPLGFDAFSGANDLRGTPPVEVTSESPLEVSGTFFSSGGATTRIRTYRPKQRTSLPVAEDAVPTVPAGWKADPTGRHQFRYWDGFHWTENVADAGAQTRDAVTP
jgi:hypothetical protein